MIAPIYNLEPYQLACSIDLLYQELIQPRFPAGHLGSVGSVFNHGWIDSTELACYDSN